MENDLLKAQSDNDAMDACNKELNARILAMADTCTAHEARAAHTIEHSKSNMAYADSLSSELATANRVFEDYE